MTILNRLSLECGFCKSIHSQSEFVLGFGPIRPFKGDRNKARLSLISLSSYQNIFSIYCFFFLEKRLAEGGSPISLHWSALFPFHSPGFGWRNSASLLSSAQSFIIFIESETACTVNNQRSKTRMLLDFMRSNLSWVYIQMYCKFCLVNRVISATQHSLVYENSNLAQVEKKASCAAQDYKYTYTCA